MSLTQSSNIWGTQYKWGRNGDNLIFITMKYIITESQSLFLKRRINQIDELVSIAMQEVDPIDYNYRDYAEEIAWQVADSYEQKLGEDELAEVLDFVKDYYGKQIKNYYIKRNELLYEQK